MSLFVFLLSQYLFLLSTQVPPAVAHDNGYLEGAWCRTSRVCAADQSKIVRTCCSWLQWRFPLPSLRLYILYQPQWHRVRINGDALFMENGGSFNGASGGAFGNINGGTAMCGQKRSKLPLHCSPHPCMHGEEFRFSARQTPCLHFFPRALPLSVSTVLSKAKIASGSLLVPRNLPLIARFSAFVAKQRSGPTSAPKMAAPFTMEWARRWRETDTSSTSWNHGRMFPCWCFFLHAWFECISLSLYKILKMVAIVSQEVDRGRGGRSLKLESVSSPTRAFFYVSCRQWHGTPRSTPAPRHHLQQQVHGSLCLFYCALEVWCLPWSFRCSMIRNCFARPGFTRRPTSLITDAKREMVALLTTRGNSSKRCSCRAEMALFVFVCYVRTELTMLIFRFRLRMWRLRE